MPTFLFVAFCAVGLTGLKQPVIDVVASTSASALAAESPAARVARLPTAARPQRHQLTMTRLDVQQSSHGQSTPLRSGQTAPLNPVSRNGTPVGRSWSSVRRGHQLRQDPAEGLGERQGPRRRRDGAVGYAGRGRRARPIPHDLRRQGIPPGDGTGSIPVLSPYAEFDTLVLYDGDKPWTVATFTGPSRAGRMNRGRSRRIGPRTSTRTTSASARLTCPSPTALPATASGTAARTPARISCAAEAVWIEPGPLLSMTCTLTGRVKRFEAVRSDCEGSWSGPARRTARKSSVTRHSEGRQSRNPGRHGSRSPSRDPRR